MVSVDDDDVDLNVLGCLVHISGTHCDQCVSMVHCCFTSTESIRLIKDGEPRTATSTFTQLLNFLCGRKATLNFRTQAVTPQASLSRAHPPSSAVIRITTLNGKSLTPCTIVQELCESRGGRPGLSVLTSLLVSVDVKNY